MCGEYRDMRPDPRGRRREEAYPGVDLKELSDISPDAARSVGRMRDWMKRLSDSISKCDCPGFADNSRYIGGEINPTWTELAKRRRDLIKEPYIDADVISKIDMAMDELKQMDEFIHNSSRYFGNTCQCRRKDD